LELKRKAYNKLLQWKQEPERKPLLIRGARQVGKTTLVRQFAKEFIHYIELNLERETDRAIFEMDDINKIINASCLLKGVQADNRPLLMFIDEIQESPKAISKLRYFYEERPDIFVIAAGSLLEFALKNVASFPVGRISYLYLYPLNFEEYLNAIQQTSVLELLNTLPIPEYAHNILLDLFHEYAIIGGMPEIVKKYVKNKNLSLLPTYYNQLWQAYKDDVEKYASNNTERKVLRHVIETAPFETDRIKFEGFGKSNYRSREVGEAIRALELAGIVRLIHASTSMSPPIMSDIKKRPRLQFLDTGLLNHSLLIQGELLSVKDLNNFHRGKIIQHLVTQEIISINDSVKYSPHFWVREEKDSNSELDLIYHSSNTILPIEIKSGKQGTLRSLHQFIVRANCQYAIRLYAGEFNIENAKTPDGTSYKLMNMPYYLSFKLPEYAIYLMSNFNQS
jgi:predicted AAA+ superfamily ATPase